MRTRERSHKHVSRGLSLVELLVAMVITATVMGGAIQAVVLSKNNFIMQRELATLQENARYAISYIQDQVRLARFNSCSAAPLYTFNAVIGASAAWSRNGVGVFGFDDKQPASVFPDKSVLPRTDALVVRHGAGQRYLLVNHSVTATTGRLTLNRRHDIEVGDIAIVASANCDAVGYMQVSAIGADWIVQNDLSVTSTAGVWPGNCHGGLISEKAGAMNCANLGAGPISLAAFPQGSAVMKLVANAFYLRKTADGIPALYRERLGVIVDDSATWSEELVQGVENMQFSYGVDNALNDGVADIYLAANAAAMDWSRVVSVRLSLRMRSINPLYREDVAFGEFMGIPGTNGRDRFMRQTLTTTISLRN